MVSVTQLSLCRCASILPTPLDHFLKYLRVLQKYIFNKL